MLVTPADSKDLCPKSTASRAKAAGIQNKWRTPAHPAARISRTPARQTLPISGQMLPSAPSAPQNEPFSNRHIPQNSLIHPPLKPIRENSLIRNVWLAACNFAVAKRRNCVPCYAGDWRKSEFISGGPVQPLRRQQTTGCLVFIRVRQSHGRRAVTRAPHCKRSDGHSERDACKSRKSEGPRGKRTSRGEPIESDRPAATAGGRSTTFTIASPNRQTRDDTATGSIRCRYSVRNFVIG